jgi:hypothetical protein
MWQRQSGNAEAKALIARYPTPRALRRPLGEEVGILSDTVRALPWKRDTTIGDVVSSVYFRARDVSTLHAILTQHAQDSEVWTAPDGTQTRRPL